MTFIKTFLLLFSIGIFCFYLSSCAQKQYHLAIDASIIKKGQTKEKVKELVGQPDYIVKDKNEKERWYYAHDITPFYKKIPLIGKLFGPREVEVIEITFYLDHVSKVIYYVAPK